jgi:DNA polymerase I-like protein with 3'-5' exonuclease and polymerase domains
LDKLSNIRALDIIRWIKYGVETPMKYFQIIPNADVSKYVPFMMSMVPSESLYLDEEEEVFFERMCVRDNITRWMSTRYVSFSYDFDKNLDFLYRDNAKLAKLNYSTKKTLTGRIPCNDRYNPQNLSKDNEDRTKIISRFRNGRIYQFDYTSFEARIALYLSGDEDFIQDYYDKDLHSETAVIIFETLDFTEEQRNVAKLANMAIMYGASEATAMKLLGKFPEPLEKLQRIKGFLAPIFKRAKEIIEESNNNGYLINKWGSIIKPEKDYAGFNNYLQSTASEIVVDKICEIKQLLKPYRSQFLFQVHDSLVFDVHPEEVDIVQIIAKTLSYNRGMMFTINYKSGPNYKDLSSESVYF